MEGDGARICVCLDLVVALVHSAGWMSIMDANPHPGPGEFPELSPDLQFLGPVLLHFYEDMSLTIGPADGSPPQFRDHWISEWGGIQSQGANALQRLLETLDRASLRTLLGGLGNKNWHRLGTQWSEIRIECAVLGAAGAQRLVTSPRHHDLLNAITYLMCSMLKEDVQTCDDALSCTDQVSRWFQPAEQ